MVKKRYIRGTCEGLFGLESKAQNCENEGYIGPEIKGGLLFGISDISLDSYSIILKTTDGDHRKMYDHLGINYMKQLLANKNFTIYEFHHHFVDDERHGADYIGILMKNNKIRILDDKEFQKVSNDIYFEKNAEEVRRVLRKNNIKVLYNKHNNFNLSDMAKKF